MASLTVTLIQSDLKWEDKKANLQMLKDKINNIDLRTELIILPEMFSTGFTMRAKDLAETMEGESVNWMKQVAGEKKIILIGSLIIEENGKFYNRLILMLPNEQYAWYDKRHLFGFAKEDEYYTGGNKRLIASVNGWKINLQVCYDLRFPVWARQSGDILHGDHEAVGLEYDVLIYVANWPERRNTAWKSLLRARAIENQCFVIGVNRVGEDGNGIYYSGDSMIIDPLGEIIYEKANIEDVFSYQLNKEKLSEVRTKFPFWKDADPFKLSS